MNKSKNFKSGILNLAIVMYALYAIKCVWLAFATVEYSPIFAFLMQIPLAFSFVLGIFLCANYKMEKQENRWLVFLPFVYFLFNMFHSYEKFDFITNAFTLIIIEMFILFNADIKIKIFDVFYWIIQGCNIISVFFFLLYNLNINIGFQIIPYYNLYINASYIKWIIFAIYRSSTELRLCGIFNEPGALGTVCALLFAARFNYSRRWEKVLLAITIACTYSVAGYIIVFVFISMYVLKKDARNIIFLIVGVGLFLLAPDIDWGNEKINHLMSRFSITDGGFAGDNRTTHAFDDVYQSFSSSRDYFFGCGQGYPLPIGVSSYKTYIVEYGIIGFSFWMLSWVMATLKDMKGNKTCLLFVLCYFLSIYQRPRLIASIYGYVLLFGGIEWILSQTKQKEVVYEKGKK